MAGKKGKANEVPAAETASFFHKIAPIETFLHMKAPRRDKKDKRQVTLMFRMPLNGNNVRSAPVFIQTAFTGVKDHGEDLVSLKKVISGVDIQIYLSEKLKRSDFDLTQVSLTKLAVKEISSSKGDATIVLTFEVVYPWEAGLWRFLGVHYASKVFLKFDAEQASLLDLEDASDEDGPEEDDEDQPVLEMPISGKDASAGEVEG
jgi:hypothetical protein